MEIFLDMDDVLFDFTPHAMTVFGKHYTESQWPEDCQWMTDWFGISHEAFWGHLLVHRPDFWSNIPLSPWADPLIEITAELDRDWKILSSPMNCSLAASGKINAMRRHFGHYFRRFHLTPCEFKCDLAGPGRVLIDDRDDNCRQWEDAGGRAIVFPQPWNSGRKHIQRRLEYVEQELQEASEAFDHLN